MRQKAGEEFPENVDAVLFIASRSFPSHDTYMERPNEDHAGDESQWNSPEILRTPFGA